MKKLLAVSILSLAALGMATAPASAIFRCCGLRCCNKCCSYICCRQYNAFTPVCFGNICCIGCCPVAPPCCPVPGYGSPYGGPCCGPSSCGGDSCSIGGQLPPAALVNSDSSGNPVSGTTSPVYASPMPNPLPNAPMPTSRVWPAYMGHNMIQSAGYYPGYYPQQPVGGQIGGGSQQSHWSGVNAFSRD